MRTILVSLAIILFCSFARAQWVQTNGPESGEAFCLAAGGKDLFVGTEDGVYRSSDDGTSWLPTGLRNTIVLSLAIKFAGESDTSLFAGEAGGVVRSTNNGASWSQADFGLRGNRVR